MSSTAGKVIKCKAAVAWAPKTPLSIEEVEVAPPRANEVRVKIIASGVCHTDYSFLNGIFIRGCRFPIIFGHEGAGVVESIGEGVTKFKPGDHVIPLYVPQCFECRACKGNKTNLCEKIRKTQSACVMPDGTSRFTCKGKTVYHSMGTSTFSEYTVVADISLAKIDEKAPLEKVCLIGCGISTGYGAVQQAAKIIKCRAAVAWAANEPFSIEEVEVAPPKANEVRVKVTATGVCQTDISFLHGHIPHAITFPVILGHEGSGVVESIGEGVTNFQPGDHVILLYTPQCFNCPGCLNPKTNQCLKLIRNQMQGLMQDNTTRFTCKGQTVYHSMGTSTFSEYTVVNDVSLVKVDENVPLEKICLIACAVATGYGAAVNTAQVEPGSRCAIWGLGGIGLSVILGCKAAGASKIYGIDINADKFEIAKKLGCTDVLNPKDFDRKNFIEVLTQMTGGGFDYTFECIGNVHTISNALEASNRFYGMSVIIGVPPAGKNLDIPPGLLLTGRTLKGSMFGGFRGVEGVSELVAKYTNGELKIDDLITHNIKLDDINRSLELMKDGRCVRCVVNF